MSEKFVGKAKQSVSVEMAFPNENKHNFQLHCLNQSENHLLQTILKFQKILFFCLSQVLNPKPLAQKSSPCSGGRGRCGQRAAAAAADGRRLRRSCHPCYTPRQEIGKRACRVGWCKAAVAVNKPAFVWFGSMRGPVPESLRLASKPAGPGWRTIGSGTQSTYSARVSMYTYVPFRNERNAVQD